MGKILVIDDKEYILDNFRAILEREGHSVLTARTYNRALSILGQQSLDLIYTDIYLEENEYGKVPLGINILKEVEKRKLLCPVVIITIDSRIETAIDAVHYSAFDYLKKPVEEERLVKTTRIALKQKSLLEGNEQYRKNLEAIFRSVKDAIITIDHKGLIIEANEAVKTIFDLYPKEIVDNPLDTFLLPGFGTSAASICHLIKNQETIEEMKMRWNTTSGTQSKFLLMTSNPLKNARMDNIGTILVFKDNTRLVAMEQELSDRYMFAGLISKNEKMRQIFRSIQDYANSDANVLIYGESGTGKEKIARALHDYSSRSSKNFIRADFASLNNDNLIQSELFGYVEGAFTGAHKRRIGRFQEAQQGSIFLDEIDKASLETQAKLLRVIEYKKIAPLGTNREVDVDVRIIIATNQDLAKLTGQEKFREDLFYRLMGSEITIPPLRDRQEDIPLLVKYFIQSYNEEFSKTVRDIADDVYEYFSLYPWPGNIRQLRQTICRACQVCKDRYITLDYIPREQLEKSDILSNFIVKNCENKTTLEKTLGFVQHYFIPEKNLTLKQSIKNKLQNREVPETLRMYINGKKYDMMTKEVISHALTQSKGNKVKAAAKLNISREYLHRLIRKYGLTVS